MPDTIDAQPPLPLPDVCPADTGRPPERIGLVVTPVPKVPFWKFRNFNVLQPNLVITS